MRLITTIGPLFALFLATGCDGKIEDSWSDSGYYSYDFACDSTTCTSGSEYCVLTMYSGTVSAANCYALPSDCSACDCAQEDASAQSSSCESYSSCSSSGAEITVTCG